MWKVWIFLWKIFVPAWKWNWSMAPSSRKIVLAHLKESMDYYKRLQVAEIEGDILKALVAKNLAKVEALHKKLAQAKLALCQAEAKQLG